MIKNYKQFINEDLRNKKISLFDDNHLKQLYPDIQLMCTDDFKIVISCDKTLELNNKFYQTLEKDRINKGDIVFENCDIIIVYDDITGLTKISDYGEFRSGIKYFSCNNCQNLTSLQGSPKEVTGHFYCANCTNLASLDGSPDVVHGDFYCSNCENLTSLEGAPSIVDGAIDCNNCKNLISLDGSPKTANIFRCYDCGRLTNLDGAPDVINRNFYCIGCIDDFIELAKQKYGSKVKYQ